MKKTLIVILFLSFGIFFSQNRTSAINKTFELEKKDSLYQDADELPVYPGGISAFRNNFAKTFDSSKINANGLGKSEARFVISEDGIITDIVIIGENKSMNKEMERSIKSMSKTKWKPALLNGQPVKYLFRLPITMNFYN
ncbi:energy transducer TonB [Chryseobacterium sp. Ch-15]|uniref:Energy transducer TonB n=1 Tax=Chryseobacterium muglaense TaxID=2893752 RepID=A0A9Q3YTT5_9FLAO|nr:energy transducer TonB [Chryseobacterium muglaense]MBD3904966.1 energy transducer TonB [Chryseobacterium muglaense]MCC9035167.1 energy transducer TonB [Chryseobacterium muglaense]MCM2554666.1 energy transducer TonB [Chryseobacterium muglaense]